MLYKANIMHFFSKLEELAVPLLIHTLLLFCSAQLATNTNPEFHEILCNICFDFFQLGTQNREKIPYRTIRNVFSFLITKTDNIGGKKIVRFRIRIGCYT